MLFSTTNLRREKHVPGWHFAGPGTELTTQLRVPASTANIALSKDEKPSSNYVNYLDKQAKYFDISYYNIQHDLDLNDNKKLNAKHKSDQIMITMIAKYSPASLKERFYRLVIIN